MAKKILVIDDSALMRRVISDIINEGNEYEVAAIAKDGLEGFDLIVSNPNLYSAIILDINMPKMNGLELLQKLQKNHIEQTVIVVSTVAKEGAKETIQALEYGAFDFVTKPENYFETKGNDFKKRIHDMLNVATSSKASVERTRSATDVKPSGYSGSRLTSGRTSLISSEKKASIDAISALRRRNEINDTIPPKVNPSRFTNIKSGSKKVVALACSTGGPKSLQQVIPMLPKNLDAGVVLVQHMPAGFTASLAARLNEISDINVKEGADGDVIQKGWVYIAPGGKHIKVVKKASEYVIKLNDEPPIDGLRPCANVMYKSLVQCNYDEITCVVLTGMGADGTEAIEKKMNVFIIKVSVDENCILKAARAFLVFKNLEGHCDIIKSEPSAQDIEDEKFELDFSIVVVTEESYESIVGIIKNVSEIKDAAGEAITTPFADEDDKEEKQDTPKQEEKKDESETKPSAPVTAKKQAPVANNNKAGKTVSHTVRVDIEKLDVLMNLVSELIIAKNGLVSASVSEDGTTSVNQKFGEQIEYLERVTTNLHESVMKVRMMPIESVFAKYPRMIRDLNKKLGKKMELYMSGEETELDRTVIDEIGDPIMHLLRNSADHGLESAEIRAERGKPEVGSIWLDAYQEGNNVVIEVRDDGNGIDVEKVKQKAVEKGNLTQEQADALTEKEAIDLLFKPSFSTSDKVTDVSGRGVGLDVVKSKIEALGGDVEVKTKYGEGSTFSIRLPLTLAIIQALMVKVGEEKYAIALGSIETIEDVPVSEIKYVHAKEVINLRGNVIPLIRLRELLDVPGEPEESDNIVIVIVRKGDKLAGLVVDNLIGQMEIVIKSLGKYININRMISGATILGDGSVALIIDANTLV